MKNILFFFFMLTSLVFDCTAQSLMKISEVEGNTIFRKLVTAIYAELGYETEFVFVPAERGLINVDYGFYDADIVRVAGVISEYPNLIETSEPLTEGYLQLWIRNGSNIIITSPDDLKKYTLGLIIGMKRAENYAASLGLEPVMIVKMENLNFMLLANHIDVALVPSTAITPDFSDGIHAVVPKLEYYRGFHILNKKHAELAPKFDAILKAMKADGRYKLLIQPK